MTRALLIMAGLVLFGCDNRVEPEPSQLPENAIVERITIELTPTGFKEIGREQITVAQQLDEREALESGVSRQALIEIPVFCSNTDLRLYDGAFYTGNQLCMRGWGAIVLESLPRGSSGLNWRAAVRSYRTGAQHGAFTTSDGFPDLGTPDLTGTVYLFPANESTTRATHIVSTAGRIGLDL